MSELNYELFSQAIDDVFFKKIFDKHYVDIKHTIYIKGYNFGLSLKSKINLYFVPDKHLIEDKTSELTEEYKYIMKGIENTVVGTQEDKRSYVPEQYGEHYLNGCKIGDSLLAKMIPHLDKPDFLD